MIRMIATDLDRTLLRADKTISAYTADVLRRCQANGICVAFATARSEKSSERITSVFTPDVMISNGGALARLGDVILHRSVLTRETANRLIARMFRAPGVGFITADTPGGYFADHPVDPENREWQDYLHAVHIDFANGIGYDAYKLTVQFFDPGLPGRIAADFPEVDMLPFSDDNWVRFARKDAVKWKAVSAAAAHLGISPAAVAAFGDDYNDIEMLRECGVGVAVADAIDEAKAVADFICDTGDNDGVAKWIEENVPL